MEQLKGKIAIVTGGSRGIGFIIAQELVKKGVLVLICSRNKKDLLKASKKIDPTLSQIAYFVADVSKEKECKKLVQYAIKKFGRLDILINNAGIYGPIGLFEDNSEVLWKKTIETNFLGTVFCCKYALPIMKKNKSGTIINIAGAGVGSFKTLPRFSAYYSSKIAIVGFSETLAQELKEYNISVNSLSPGAFYTDFTKEVILAGVKKAGKDMFNYTLKQKKNNSSFEKLLDFVIFLCLNTSKDITGRFFSANWDQIPDIKKIKNQKNLYKLRRIDNLIFNEKKK